MNIDVDNTVAGAAGDGLPAAGYTAAATPCGPNLWQGVAAGATAGVALVDCALGATAATWSNTGGFNFGFNNVGTAGNEQFLMDDGQDGASTITIAGLLPGAYDVYTYAWAPDSPGVFITNVSVNGGAAQVVGSDVASPAPPGVPYTTPGHYALHVGVTPVAGSITIACTVGTQFVTINGIQLRHTPLVQPPVNYCTAGTTTNGCSATISANVNPNVANNAGVTIAVANVEGQKQGLYFYGIDNSGFSPLPWSPGSSSFLCVKSPTQRAGLQSSGGTTNACNGSFSLNWDAFVAANPTAVGVPFAAGNKIFMQAWFRDPPAPKTTNLSNAVEMTVQP